MSFFKNLFGKSGNPGNTSQPASGQQSATDSQSNTLPNNEPPTRKVFPVIKPGNWEGITQGAVKQTIIGTYDDPVIITAFAYDDPGNFSFVLHHTLKPGTTPQEVVDEAYRNIDAYPSQYEPYKNEHGTILTASGKYFSSEKILCPDFMNEAHRMLNTDTLIVSIPRRTCLTLIDYNSNKALVEDFKKLHYYTYNDNSYGNAQITDGFFIVKNGDITEFKFTLIAESLSDLQIQEDGSIVDEFEVAKDLYAEKKYEECKVKLLDVINKNPQHFEAQNYLAFTYDRIDNDYPEAEKYYLMALKNNPEFGAANINYAGMLSYKKRFDEAKKYLEKSELIPDINKASLAFEWGYYYECTNQFDKAIAKFKENGMLTYNTKDLEDILERINRIKKKKEIMES